jgi:hypothetical protein
MILESVAPTYLSQFHPSRLKHTRNPRLLSFVCALSNGRAFSTTAPPPIYEDTRRRKKQLSLSLAKTPLHFTSSTTTTTTTTNTTTFTSSASFFVSRSPAIMRSSTTTLAVLSLLQLAIAMPASNIFVSPAISPTQSTSAIWLTNFLLPVL